MLPPDSHKASNKQWVWRKKNVISYTRQGKIFLIHYSKRSASHILILYIACLLNFQEALSTQERACAASCRVCNVTERNAVREPRTGNMYCCTAELFGNVIMQGNKNHGNERVWGSPFDYHTRVQQKRYRISLW